MRLTLKLSNNAAATAAKAPVSGDIYFDLMVNQLVSYLSDCDQGRGIARRNLPQAKASVLIQLRNLIVHYIHGNLSVTADYESQLSMHHSLLTLEGVLTKKLGGELLGNVKGIFNCLRDMIIGSPGGSLLRDYGNELSFLQSLSFSTKSQEQQSRGKEEDNQEVINPASSNRENDCFDQTEENKDQQPASPTKVGMFAAKAATPPVSPKRPRKRRVADDTSNRGGKLARTDEEEVADILANFAAQVVAPHGRAH